MFHAGNEVVTEILPLVEWALNALDWEGDVVLVLQDSHKHILLLLATIEYELNIRAHRYYAVALPKFAKALDVREVEIATHLVGIQNAEEAKQVVVVAEAKICRSAIFTLDSKVCILNDVVNKVVERCEITLCILEDRALVESIPLVVLDKVDGVALPAEKIESIRVRS